MMRTVFLIGCWCLVVAGCSDGVGAGEFDAGSTGSIFIGSGNGGGGGGEGAIPSADAIFSTDVGGGGDSDTSVPPSSDCAEDHAPCDDSNPCTSDDICENGVCKGGNFICDDGLVCTDDFCDAQGVCSHEIGLGWCNINGECFLSAETNPADPCQICSPQNSATEWFFAGADGETSGPTCGSAFNLGDLSDAGVTENLVGSIAEVHESDWYVFEGVDDVDLSGCDSYHVRARLLQNPGQAYALDIRMGNCLVESGICVNVQDFEWYTNFFDGELGECLCTSIEAETADDVHLCTDNSSRYYVRVYLKDGADAGCAPYLLEISNGIY